MSNNEETDKRAGNLEDEELLFVRPKRRKTGEIEEEDEKKEDKNADKKSNTNSNTTPILSPGEERESGNYVCNICQKSFGKDRNLKNHMRKVHVSPTVAQEEWEKRRQKRHEEMEKQGKSFHCLESSCKKSFATKTQLDLHFKGAHIPEYRRVNKCPVEGCERVFTQRGALKTHTKAVHGPKSKV